MTSSRDSAPTEGLPGETAAILACPVIDLAHPTCSGFTVRGLSTRCWNRIMTFREPMSGLTHFIGILLAMAGCAVLIGAAVHPVRPWHLFSYAVFGISMVLLYVVSTLFHWMTLPKESVLILRKCDHIMIFIFIAASYTPFCLVPFRGPFGWTIFISIWTIALCGSISKALWFHMPKWLCLTLYLCAGLFSLVAAGPILSTLKPWAIIWLAAGGLAYCVGAVFYALENHDEPPPLFGCHETFHLFVILGSCAHFWVVYRYITEFA